MRVFEASTDAYAARVPILLEMRGDQVPIAGLELSHDGRLLAANLVGGRSQIWSLDAGRPVRGFASPGTVVATALLPGGKGGIAALDSGALLHWPPQKAEWVPIRQLGVRPASLAVAPDGTTVAVGSATGEIVLVDLAQQKEVRRIKAHAGPVVALDLSDDAAIVLSSGPDGTAAVWESSTGVRVASHPGATAGGGPIRFVKGATHFLAVTADTGVALWRVGGTQPVRVFSASRGATALASAGDLVGAAIGEAVRAWSLDGAPRLAVAKAHPGGAAGVALDPQGRFVFSGGADGLVKIWDATTGRGPTTLVAGSAGWAVIDEDGRFDGNGGGLENVRWAIARTALPIENFSDALYEPNLLRKRLGGLDAWATRPGELVKGGILPPPLAQIQIDGEVAIPADGILELPVQVTDLGGGVSKINLFHNGKIVDPDNVVATTQGKTARGRTTLRTVFRLRLVSGRNSFLAEAASSERILGPPHRVVLDVDLPARQPVLYVLALALDEYKDDRLNLNYAVADAQAVVKALKSGNVASGFRDIEVIEVRNAQASRQGIVAALEKLAATAPEDVVVIYMASHGEAKGEEYYMIPYDFPAKAESADLDRHALAFSEIQRALSRVGAQRIVMFIDACKSGAAVASGSQDDENRAIRRLGMAIGLHVVSATTQDQFAVEVKRLGHGVFTYALTRGLAGEADRAPADGLLTVKELLGFTEREVPVLSERFAKHQQWPVAFSRGVDFTLARAQP